MSEILPTQAAWASGLFDGEGCLYVHKILSKGLRPYYNVIACVHMKPDTALNQMQAMYGGKVGKQPSSFMWRLTKAVDVIAFLRSIRPFSVIKASEIDLILDDPLIWDKQRGSRYSQMPAEIFSKRVAVHAALQQAKH